MLTVAFLLAAYGLLRSSAGFGPTAGSRPVRVVASCGLAVLAVESTFAVNGLRVPRPGEPAGPPDTRHAVALLVLLAVIILAYLTALVQATARRSDLSPATVATGTTVAAAAASAWLTIVVVQPDLGTRNGPALAAIAAAGLLAATVSAHRTATRQGPSEADAGLVAGLRVRGYLSPHRHRDRPAAADRNLRVHRRSAGPLDPPAAHLVDSVAVWLIGLIAVVALAVRIHRQSRIGAEGERNTRQSPGAGSPVARDRSLFGGTAPRIASWTVLLAAK